jgi:MFS-type transporter involved in bile tolerance (Atg22 family)
LTQRGNLGYNVGMLGSVISLVLRIWLIAAFAATIWRFVKPKTQLMRVCRAALLVLGLLAIMALFKVTGT